MTFPSRGTEEFWILYRGLDAGTKALTRKSYRLWSENPFHPSLHFKLIGKSIWSVRISRNFRAVGRFVGNSFVWEWIGSHDAYSKRY